VLTVPAFGLMGHGGGEREEGEEDGNGGKLHSGSVLSVERTCSSSGELVVMVKF
jgi:hypothetical protein